MPLCECFKPATHPGPCDDDGMDLILTPRPSGLNGGETIYRATYPLPQWETLTEEEVDSMLDEVL